MMTRPILKFNETRVGGHLHPCERASMASRVRITPLDGIGRVGGATWLIQQGRSAFLIDFGSDLQASGRMLGGRLRPRASRGIEDYLGIGLLQPFDGLYRTDLVIDDDVFEDAQDVSVTDLLLSHAHHDHSGNLFALDPLTRIHTSSITAAMLFAEMTTSGGLFSESTHYQLREPHPTEHGILTLQKKALTMSRPCSLTDGDPSAAMRDLWKQAGSDEGLQRSDLVVAGMPFESWGVDHSVFGACGFIVHSDDQGAIAFAGDLRAHGSEAELTETFINRLAKLKPRVLILEGTRLGREDEPRVTEAQCRAEILELVRGARRRLVIATVSPKHLERLASFLNAAQETGRQIVVQPRTMFLLEAVAAAKPFYDLASLDGIAVYDPPMTTRPGWHRDLRERHPKRLVHPDDIQARQGKFIYMHGFSKTMEWTDFKPFGALYVHSASGAYDDSARNRLGIQREWIELYKIETAGIKFGPKGGLEFDQRLNPSGHMHPRDLKELLHRVQPASVLVCHSDQPELMRDLLPQGTRLVLPENGKTFRL